MAVRASEFGAPLSAKDEQGFPVLFQPIEKSMDAILKRVVGDLAKSNTGRLVRTAMGEVLDFYMEKEYHDDFPTAATTAATTTTAMGAAAAGASSITASGGGGGGDPPKNT